MTTAMLRSALLRGSQSAWLRERATRYGFVRRSVKRFIPGDRLEDALAAAGQLQRFGAGAILTRLGENVSDGAEADEVAQHYRDVIASVAASGLDAQVSIKPTQLGLDLGFEECYGRLRPLVRQADAAAGLVWIDMEGSAYVDRTLALFRRARQESAAVGICLQAYLYRTTEDLASLLPLRPAVRLVKGAYDEPPSIALPRKRDVDENFLGLARQFIRHAAAGQEALLGVATHDGALIDRIRRDAGRYELSARGYEVQMLYGIRPSLQQQLVAAGTRLRVLVSYGEYWFPWYMRRLAERPANVLFLARNLVAG